MFEREDEVGEKVPGLWCDGLWHCNRAVDPLNTGDVANDCGILYPDRLQPIASIKWAYPTRFPIFTLPFARFF